MINEQAHCTYTTLEKHIHKLIVLKADRRGADEALGYIKTIFDAHDWESKQIVRLMVDLRPDGMPPIAYTMSKIMRTSGTHDTNQLRVAYMINHNILITTVYTLANMLKAQTTRKIFEGDEPEVEQGAIAWLLETPNRTAQGEETNAL